MKSKLILLLAVLIFTGLTILLSIFIEKNKSIPKEKIEKNNSSQKIEFDTVNEINASGAMESMQWMSQIRAYPDSDIPSDKYFKAFEYSKENLQTLNHSDNSNLWESIGPNNIGGRSLCVAVHPVDTGTVFIGSASGGLWKSVTGGVTVGMDQGQSWARHHWRSPNRQSATSCRLSR